MFVLNIFEEAKRLGRLQEGEKEKILFFGLCKDKIRIELVVNFERSLKVGYFRRSFWEMA